MTAVLVIRTLHGEPQCYVDHENFVSKVPALATETARIPLTLEQLKLSLNELKLAFSRGELK